jgi:hypothetical protein
MNSSTNEIKNEVIKVPGISLDIHMLMFTYVDADVKDLVSVAMMLTGTSYETDVLVQTYLSDRFETPA